MKRKLFAALLACAPGCASFGHGVWNNRQEVFARLDHLEETWREAGGTIAGASVAPFVVTGNALLYLLFAGLSGASHAIEVPTDVLGLTRCEECEAHATTRPAK